MNHRESRDFAEIYVPGVKKSKPTTKDLIIY